MSVLLFFIVLVALILVHELGHFVVAKWTGMRVDEFGIGFPPKVFGVKKGETEYSLNALPIGGFVRIFGENMGEADAHTADGRAFTDKSKWAQAAVLVAGVTMNVIFAWLLFVVVLLMGIPSVVEESAAGSDATLTVTEVIAESPAADAGITPGAEITSVRAGSDSLASLTPSAFVTFLENHQDTEITLSYQSDGTDSTATIAPEAGVLESDESRAALGIALSLVEVTEYSFIGAFGEATTMTVSSLSAITVGLGSLIADSVTLDADFSQVAGPVGIVGLVGDAAEIGLASLIIFTAIISLNLAIINMLPFPALDGGRLLFVAIEAITRRPINPEWAARANLVGFALLMVLMIAVTYNDILRIL